MYRKIYEEVRKSPGRGVKFAQELWRDLDVRGLVKKILGRQPWHQFTTLQKATIIMYKKKRPPISDLKINVEKKNLPWTDPDNPFLRDLQWPERVVANGYKIDRSRVLIYLHEKIPKKNRGSLFDTANKYKKMKYEAILWRLVCDIQDNPKKYKHYAEDL